MRPVRSLIPIVVFMTIVCLSSATQSRPRPKTDSQTPARASMFRVIGYLPDYRLASFDPAQAHYVTDIIYFSLEPLANGELNTERVMPDVLQKLHHLAKAGSTRLLIAVGGWQRSGGYAAMVTDPAARKRFAANLTRYCLANSFEGAEFDWEGPGNPQEKAGYAALMQDTHQSFAPHKLRVTVAQAAWDILNKEGLDAVDEIHIMAYDHDGRHSTLPDSQEDVRAFIKQGVPKRKLFLGLPFYGRNIHDRNKEMTYSEIVAKYHPAPATDLVDDIYFNNIDTLDQKTKWAKDEGLGGVMAWEIGQDTVGKTSLLQAVSRAVAR